MSIETFILLSTTQVKCSECDELSSHILIGRENEILGLYCYFHGEIRRSNLENKYQFEKEMRWQATKRKKPNRKSVWSVKKNSKQRGRKRYTAQINVGIKRG